MTAELLERHCCLAVAAELKAQASADHVHGEIYVSYEERQDARTGEPAGVRYSIATMALGTEIEVLIFEADDHVLVDHVLDPAPDVPAVIPCITAGDWGRTW